jgi:hypothetical protein
MTNLPFIEINIKPEDCGFIYVDSYDGTVFTSFSAYINYTYGHDKAFAKYLADNKKSSIFKRFWHWLNT